MDTPTVAAITFGFGALGAAFAFYQYNKPEEAALSDDLSGGGTTEDTTGQRKDQECERRKTPAVKPIAEAAAVDGTYGSVERQPAAADFAVEARDEVTKQVSAWGTFWQGAYDDDKVQREQHEQQD